MITFLPLPDFRQSAEVLDKKRLNKQCLEARQLFEGGWSNHPASKMWERYRGSLADYGFVFCKVAVERGINQFKNLKFFEDVMFSELVISLPLWLGDIRLHSSHRANLLRKDIDYYSKFGWLETPQKGYYWPCG
jgi:hypothetical protein